jgi:hemerythrin-like domain-containing protein
LVKAAEAAEAAAPEAAENAQVARDFLVFWAEDTARHFREEEEVLLPAAARYGDPSHADFVRVLVEHIRIRRLAGDLRRQLESGQPSSETMRDLGLMLRAHIRHEEDVVFPLIEQIMPEAALQELGKEIAAFINS